VKVQDVRCTKTWYSLLYRLSYQEKKWFDDYDDGLHAFNDIQFDTNACHRTL